jgi:hypothetical protein
VKDDKLFKELEPIAIYASPHTRMVCLDEKYRSMLPEDAPREYASGPKQIIDYSNKKFYLRDVDLLTKMYVGAGSSTQSTFGIRDLEKIVNLVASNNYYVSEKLAQLFSRVTLDSKLSCLECSIGYYLINKKKQDYTKWINCTMRELFDNAVPYNKKLETHQVQIQASAVTEDINGRKRYSVVYTRLDDTAPTDDGVPIGESALLYTTPELCSQAIKDYSIVTACYKDGKFLEFLPEGVTNKYCYKVSPSPEAKKLKMPIALWRMAHAEYVLRCLINSSSYDNILEK